MDPKKGCGSAHRLPRSRNGPSALCRIDTAVPLCRDFRTPPDRTSPPALHASDSVNIVVKMPLLRRKSWVPSNAYPSKPIKQAREISTHSAPITVCDKRLSFVSVGFERSGPVQKMNLGSKRIRHSQIHLPSVSAKHRIRQGIEIAVQNAVDCLKVGAPP